MTESGIYDKEKILQKLCNYSIQQLYKYCDMQIVGCSYYLNSYYYDLQTNCLKEIFCRELSAEILVQENDIIPLAPLKRYKGESWKNHPLEGFF